MARQTDKHRRQTENRLTKADRQTTPADSPSMADSTDMPGVTNESARNNEMAIIDTGTSSTRDTCVLGGNS